MPQVVQLHDGYSLSISSGSQSGTKAFVDASVLPGKPAVELPAIDEPWSADYPKLLVASVRHSYLGQDEACGRRYDVSFATRAATEEPSPDPAERLPMSMSCSAELRNVQVRSVDDAGKAKSVSAVARATQWELTISRKAYAANIDDWIDVLQARASKLNEASFEGIPRGCCLFVGAEMRNGTDRSTQRKWTADFHFIVRKIDDVDEDAWQMLFRPDKLKWEEAVFKVEGKDDVRLYEYADFSIFKTKDISPEGFDPEVPR